MSTIEVSKSIRGLTDLVMILAEDGNMTGALFSSWVDTTRGALGRNLRRGRNANAPSSVPKKTKGKKQAKGVERPHPKSSESKKPLKVSKSDAARISALKKLVKHVATAGGLELKLPAEKGEGKEWKTTYLPWLSSDQGTAFYAAVNDAIPPAGEKEVGEDGKIKSTLKSQARAAAIVKFLENAGVTSEEERKATRSFFPVKPQMQRKPKATGPSH
jgi:hypothetical protein